MTTQDVLLLGEVIDLGLQVFGSRENLDLWLDLPHMNLDYASPYNYILYNDDGLEEVRDLLGRILHGIPL